MTEFLSPASQRNQIYRSSKIIEKEMKIPVVLRSTNGQLSLPARGNLVIDW